MAGAFTITGANRLADYFRNEARRFPVAWSVALGTAANASGITEVVGASYARQQVGRTLADWAGTQGAGSLLASTGASQTTSNNVLIDFGAAGEAWGTVSHVGLFDAETGGDCWLWVALPVPVTVNETDTVVFSPGTLQFSIGAGGGMTKWLSNRLIDEMFRGQEWARPATWHIGYTTNANAEPNGGGYARVPYPVDFDTMSSTVDYFDTNPSDEGTTGRIANNYLIEFPIPTANQGTVTHVQVFTPAGESMFWSALAEPKTMTAGGFAPKFEPGELEIQFKQGA